MSKLYKQGKTYFRDEKLTKELTYFDRIQLYDDDNREFLTISDYEIVEVPEIVIKPMEVGWTDLKNDLSNFLDLSKRFPEELITFCFKVDKPLIALYLNGKELKTYKLEEGQEEFLLEFNGRKIKIKLPKILEMEAMYAFLRF